MSRPGASIGETPAGMVEVIVSTAEQPLLPLTLVGRLRSDGFVPTPQSPETPGMFRFAAGVRRRHLNYEPVFEPSPTPAADRTDRRARGRSLVERHADARDVFGGSTTRSGARRRTTRCGCCG
jgi:hypothetical protein